MAPHVLLNELNIPFEAKKVEAAEMKSPEFLKLNPRGQDTFDHCLWRTGERGRGDHDVPARHP
jgi:hypothetical protein